MADGDEHFRVGIEHGLDDAPLYRWQDPVHQERYDAGYTVGQFERMAAQRRLGLQTWEEWDRFEAMMKRRGLVRTR
jgi:hypothetical protein